MRKEERILSFLMANPKFVKTLQYALDWEEDEDRTGWSNYNVHTPRKDVDEFVSEESSACPTTQQRLIIEKYG